MKKYMIEQKGRSMIEMLGVLAIVGVLSVAGIAGYSKAMGKYKTNKVIDEVATIAANTKTMFASVGNYSDLTTDATGENKGTQTAYELGIFPEEMTKACDTYSDACIVNGLGGGATIKSTDAAGSSFTLVMSGLTSEACVALVTSDWGGAAGFVSVQPNSGTVVGPNSGAQAAFDAASNASTGCLVAGSSNSVTLIFY